MTDLLEREVLAVSPDEAARVLERAGLRVELLQTGPPRHPAAGGGKERVVRLQVRGNTGVITVVHELIMDRAGKGGVKANGLPHHR